ncbi:Gfo/Idh/MocA family oxidoreductase [Phytohabitans sp. ZYX-F-186]|uniref:Gfo/Idh/MocA family oxidoreductase n=1 Tax=Phytohabitans maris TaxID=3071409 RepID=A0ABU0ZWT1_9ACTN|nr:Gfo/Idh/MocA family oxidoreductase [Phytohabitans sp. ZYX-F-186]MDQ7911490.1 Gfo/Idh/MocA family oxidoreductase [Phytohabitans sp. ZYX-F-186]
MSQPTFKSVLIGANARRAAEHAAAYALVSSASLVAVSSRTPGAAEAFADRWRIPAAYRDHRDMLHTQRPDIVHLNTPPTARRELLEDCETAGVAGVVLEKPVGVDIDDLAWLRRFATETPMKIVVNHQLHFHPARKRLHDMTRAGAFGDIECVDGSARHTVAYQGTHVLQAITAVGGSPATVFAQVGGVEELTDDGRGHRAPGSCLATIEFENGSTGLFRCGAVAPHVRSTRARERHHHKRVAVVGTRGNAEWTMWGWRACSPGGLVVADHDYQTEDRAGQAALVESLCGWLCDDAAPPATRLAAALTEFATIQAMYLSALHRRPVRIAELSVPDLPAVSLLDALQRELLTTGSATRPS